MKKSKDASADKYKTVSPEKLIASKNKMK